MEAFAFASSSEAFWYTAIIISAIWAIQQVISKIVDGVVKTKQARMDVEREYLAQMVADLEEIKARLDEREAHQKSPS